MTTKERIIELCDKAEDKELDKQYESIRNEFLKYYGPEALKDLEGEELANRLFASVKKSDSIASKKRGLFSWLEHGDSGVKKGTYGYARDSAFQYGILMTSDGKCVNHRQGKPKVELTKEEAVAYAIIVKQIICDACSLIEKATLDSEAGYKEVDERLQNLCRQKESPYWTASGDLKQSLLKYLHIVFPKKVCEFYSPNYQKKVAIELGINNFDESATKFYKNGQIMLYIKEIDADGDSVRFARAVNPLVYKKKIKENDPEFEKVVTAEDEEKEEKITIALNDILYGPPGTGKTYNTVIKAVEIIEGDNFQDDGYLAIKKRYDKLVEDGRIAFTTFHQSYGYEEFLEGLKPITDDDTSGDIKYRVEDGVFKEFCERAAVGKSGKLSSKATVWKVSLDGAGRKKNKLHQKCLDEGCIRIDGSGSGDIILKRFTDDMKIGDIVLSCYSDKSIDAIGVVTDEWEYKDDEKRLKYHRPVKWIGKWTGGREYDIYKINNETAFSQQAVYRLNNISVENVISILNDPKNKPTLTENISHNYDDPYVFIIDEINRGNVSKIFGELITLIEPTKRLGAEEPMRCKLPYSGKSFGVPRNVYILGTMNTADRSLVQLDAALRRRFEFEEMMPDYEVIEDKVGVVEGIKIAEMLMAINERISVLLDREHQIGHSYLLNVKNVSDLALVFKKSIIPLLQEYFFDDYELIGKVLSGNKFIIEKRESKYLWNIDNAKKVYEINTENSVFEDPQQYIRIYSKSVETDRAIDE